MTCRQACSRLTATVVLASSPPPARGCSTIVSLSKVMIRSRPKTVIHIQQAHLSASPVPPNRNDRGESEEDGKAKDDSEVTETPPPTTPTSPPTVEKSPKPSLLSFFSRNNQESDGDKIEVEVPRTILGFPLGDKKRTLKMTREQFEEYQRLTATEARLKAQRAHGIRPGEAQKNRAPLPTQRESERIRIKEKREMRELTRLASHHKGKFFRSDTDLFSSKLAEVFPVIESKSLTGEVAKFPAILKGRVCILAMFHRKGGLDMFATWMKPFEQEFGPIPAWTAGNDSKGKELEVVYLSLIDGVWMRFLRRVLNLSMTGGWPEEIRHACFYRYGNSEDLGEKLDIRSRLSLDIMLTDRMGRVRWRGSGFSSPEDSEAMIRCALQLVEGGEGVDDVPGEKVKAKRKNSSLLKAMKQRAR